ncbi:ectonucleotide pyrophosphatase/phosphodiesterase family member 7-like [Ptychodera flava]|uniref:ectonucleotide pyrophosphatase/phosphodiesterase family member 7-like n=1 Tax=Ptychodera flava TaxID=63121 RepID=UPI003969C38F
MMDSSKLPCLKLFALLFIVMSVGMQVRAATDHKFMLVLLDGLRYDLFGADMPNLAKIAAEGVKANQSYPIFPTKSIPSMYSIATGLYAESHGAVRNYYYNTRTGEIYDYAKTCNTSEWFDTGAEPIWVTAHFEGMSTGTYMYPGGSAEIKGVRPDRDVANTEWRWYNLGFRERIDGALAWLREDDLDVTMLYYGQLDTVLHETGMDSPQTAEKLREIDEGVGYLLEELEKDGFLERMNIIFTSDHGHTTATEGIRIWNYISEDDVEFYLYPNGPFGALQPKAETMDKVYQQLKGAHPQLKVYRKDEIPDHYHYRDSERILDILVEANPPWFVIMSNSSNTTDVTIHGYDYMHWESQSIFYGYGPRFKGGYERGPFQSVNIYPLMCELLGLVPAPNNGSLDNVRDLLIDVSGCTPTRTTMTIYHLAAVVLTMTVMAVKI